VVVGVQRRVAGEGAQLLRTGQQVAKEADGVGQRELFKLRLQLRVVQATFNPLAGVARRFHASNQSKNRNIHVEMQQPRLPVREDFQESADDYTEHVLIELMQWKPL